MASDCTVELVSYRPLSSESELDGKSGSFMVPNQSVSHSIARLGRSVALVTFVILVTRGALLMIGARYIVRHDPI